MYWDQFRGMEILFRIDPGTLTTSNYMARANFLYILMCISSVCNIDFQQFFESKCFWNLFLDLSVEISNVMQRLMIWYIHYWWGEGQLSTFGILIQLKKFEHVCTSLRHHTVVSVTQIAGITRPAYTSVVGCEHVAWHLESTPDDISQQDWFQNTLTGMSCPIIDSYPRACFYD